MKRAIREIPLALMVMLAMAAAVRCDAANMTPHSGGLLSLTALGLSLLLAVVIGVRALKRRKWLSLALMVLVILFVFACDRWIGLQVPPCSECDPVEYAEWLEDTKRMN